MTGFWWLEQGNTPELSDLGKRIAACIQKHGYTARTWLNRHVEQGVENGGVGRLAYVLVSKDGKWSMSDPRPAWPAPTPKESA